ncbi:MAG: DMT family transporter [Desulfobulbaceae bacterium]|nr:DMT family transporter [Desulfobulbaceae bacterium]
MLCASACLATMSALVKHLGNDLPITELMFLRCLVALPILLGFVLLGAKPLVVKARGTLLIRSILGTFAMYCFYYSLIHMPLADCIFIGRTQPLILALLAPFVVGEKAPRLAWISICLGLVGTACVIKPSMAWSSGAWAALAGACAAAMAHLLIRKLNRTDSPTVIVFNFTFLLALYSGVASVNKFISPTPIQWLHILAISIFASSGQYLLTKAYSLDRAPLVAAASYSSVILSIIYGYFFWNETVSVSSLFGAVLIIVGGLILLSNNRDHA